MSRWSTLLPRGERNQFRQKFWEELYPHIIGEEAFIYPFLMKSKEQETQEHALERHNVANKMALKEFMACDVKSEALRLKQRSWAS